MAQDKLVLPAVVNLELGKPLTAKELKSVSQAVSKALKKGAVDAGIGDLLKEQIANVRAARPTKAQRGVLDQLLGGQVGFSDLSKRKQATAQRGLASLQNQAREERKLSNFLGSKGGEGLAKASQDATVSLNRTASQVKKLTPGIEAYRRGLANAKKIRDDSSALEKALGDKTKAAAKTLEAQTKSREKETRDNRRVSDAVLKAKEKQVRDLGALNRAKIGASSVLGVQGVSTSAGLNPALITTARDAQKATKLANAEYAVLSKRLDEVRSKSPGATKVIDRLGRSMGRAEKRAERFTARAKELVAAERKAAAAARQLGAAHEELNKPLGQGALLLRQFFRFAIGYTVLFRVLGAINSLIKGVVELDKELFSLQAITASTAEEMDTIESAIKRVATTTKFSTTEIAKAARVLGQAGVGAEQLPTTLEAVANFAAATESSLEVAADLVTTFRNVFKELDDITITNQLTKAVNISKLTATDLKSILSLSAQTAKAYNLTSEQYLAAVTTLRNAGIRASTVATGLRQGLIELFSPDSKTLGALKKRYAELGEAVQEEAIKQRFFGFSREDNPLLAVLQELDRIGFSREGQRDLQRAFDVRATNAITALINNFESLAAAEKKITFGASAAEAAQIQMLSLTNTTDNLFAAFTVFADQVGGGAVEVLRDLALAATEAVKELTALDVRLKSTGSGGLSESLVPSLAGAAAGALLPGGLGKRVVRGVAGGLAGGAGAVAAQDEGAGLADILTALGLGFLLKPAAKESIGAFKQVRESSRGGFLSFLKSSGKLLRFLPVVGSIVGLGFIVADIVSLFTGISGTDLSRASNKAEAARSLAQEAARDLEEAKVAFDEFNIEGTAPEGTTAATFQKLGRDFDDLNFALKDRLGSLAEGFDSEDLKEILLEFRKSGVARRGDLFPKIQEILPQLRGVSFPEADAKLFNAGGQVLELEAAVPGLVEDTARFVSKARELIFKAVSDDIDLFDPEQVDRVTGLKSSLALTQGIDNNPELRNLLNGISDKTAEVNFKVLKTAVTLIRDTTVESLDDLADVAFRAKRNQLSKEIKQILAAGLVNNVAPFVSNFLDTVNGSIDQQLKSFKEFNVVLERLVAVSRGDAQKVLEEARSSLSFRIAGLEQRKSDEVRVKGADIKATLVRLREGFLGEQDEALKKFFSDQKDTGSQKAFVNSLEESLSSEEGFKTALERGQEAAEGLNQSAVVWADAVLDLSNDFIAINSGLELAKRRQAQLLPLLPSVERQGNIVKLTGEVSRLSKSGNVQDLERLSQDSVDNPIREKANEQIIEQAKTVVLLLDKFSKDFPNLNEVPLGDKEERKLRSDQIKIAKEKGKLLSLELKAQEDILSQRQSLIKLQAQLEKIDAELLEETSKKRLDAAIAGGDFEEFESALRDLGEARKLILDASEKELVDKGDLVEANRSQLQAQRDLIGVLGLTSEEVEEFRSSLFKTASAVFDRVINAPITTGDPERDAKFRRAGGFLKEDRVSKVSKDITALADKIQLTEGRLGGLSSKTDKLSAIEADKLRISLRELRIQQEQYQFELRSLTEGASLALSEMFDLDSIRAQFESTALTFENLGVAVRGDFVDGLSSVGETMANAALEGRSLSTAFRELVGSVAQNVFTNIVTGLVNSAIQSLLEKFGKVSQEVKENERLAQQQILLQRQMTTAELEANTARVNAELAASKAAGTGEECCCPEGGNIKGEEFSPGEGGGPPTDPSDIFSAAIGTKSTDGEPPPLIGEPDGEPQGFFSTIFSKFSDGVGFFGDKISEFIGGIGGFGGIADSLISGLGSVLSGLFSGGSGGGVGSIVGSIASAFFAKDGGVVRQMKPVKFASGGLISGPGSSTSDSIPGVIINSDGSKSPVLVSDTEAILNAKAVDTLGADFINALNNGTFSKFAAGGLAGSVSSASNGVVSPKSTSGLRTSDISRLVTALEAVKIENTVTAVMDKRQLAKQIVGSKEGKSEVLNILRNNPKTIGSVTR